MFEKIAKILGSLKAYVWAIVAVAMVFFFLYGMYLRISETIPSSVYALEIKTTDHAQRISTLELEKAIINKDLIGVQSELQEIKQQMAENQKETRAALIEIDRDVKYILKNI